MSYYPYGNNPLANNNEGENIKVESSNDYTDAEKAKLAALNKVTTIAVTTTGNVTGYTAEMVTPGADIVRTLPAGVRDMWVYFSKLDSPPAYTVTYVPTGSDKVNNTTSLVLYANESGMLVYDADAKNWNII